jgi:BolA protein
MPLSPDPARQSERIEQIRARLEEALKPTLLEVVDDSHKHVGHAGARDGRGHFSVVIESAAFAGKPPLACHRMVYAALGELMQTEIHALALTTRSPRP